LEIFRKLMNISIPKFSDFFYGMEITTLNPYSNILCLSASPIFPKGLKIYNYSWCEFRSLQYTSITGEYSRSSRGTFTHYVIIRYYLTRLYIKTIN